MEIHESEDMITNVTDIQSARLDKYNSDAPDSSADIFETTRTIIPLKYAGMIVRAVITEPVDTTEHHDRPAIIIKHGFMASRPAYNDFANHLAADGNRVVHYGMPRSSTLYRQYHHKNLLNPLRIHSQAIGGVSALLRERYPNSPEKHRLIGHSMGGIAISKFMAHRPDHVDSAILLASAGLAEHSFLQMTQRSLQAVNNEILPYVRGGNSKNRAELALHSAWHVGRNPLFLLREGYQAATDNALPYVDQARKSGVPVGAIWMTQDSFFPLHEIDHNVQSHFDQTLITNGNHLTPQEFPKQSAREALTMFDLLRKSHVSTDSVVDTIA